MKKILALSTIFIFSCAAEEKTDCNYVVNYYPIVYKADLEFENGNYRKAFTFYQDAFNSCEAKNTSSYNELRNFTESSAILQEFETTYEYARKQVQNGVELKSFKNNSNYDEFLTSDYGKKFISEYDSIRKAFKEIANFKLRDELIAMLSPDQMYRSQGPGGDWIKQDSIDKLHEKRLIEIFENIGYPTDKIVGPPTVEYRVNVELLLLHTKDSIRMNYFVPKLIGFVKNGTAPPSVLGSLIDQYRLRNGQPIIYGTIENGNGGYANMIDDLKKVDSNRISIGLPPLELKEKKDSINEIKYGF